MSGLYRFEASGSPKGDVTQGEVPGMKSVGYPWSVAMAAEIESGCSPKDAGDTDAVFILGATLHLSGRRELAALAPISKSDRIRSRLFPSSTATKFVALFWGEGKIASENTVKQILLHHKKHIDVQEFPDRYEMACRAACGKRSSAKRRCSGLRPQCSSNWFGFTSCPQYRPRPGTVDGFVGRTRPHSFRNAVARNCVAPANARFNFELPTKNGRPGASGPTAARIPDSRQVYSLRALLRTGRCRNRPSALERLNRVFP